MKASRNRFNTLKYQVETCLREDPESRNSDIRLMNYLWFKYYPEYLFQDANEKVSINIISFYSLPNQDDIRRVRQRFQTKRLFLPTDPEVTKKRRLNEERWRKRLGYNPELRTV
jgi:hypothetical protein